MGRAIARVLAWVTAFATAGLSPSGCADPRVVVADAQGECAMPVAAVSTGDVEEYLNLLAGE